MAADTVYVRVRVSAGKQLHVQDLTRPWVSLHTVVEEQKQRAWPKLTWVREIQCLSVLRDIQLLKKEQGWLKGLRRGLFHLLLEQLCSCQSQTPPPP